MERLRERFPETLVLAFAPAGESVPGPPTAAPTGRRDHEVALDFVAEMRGAPATPDESALLRQACDACADDPDVDMLLSGAG
jgi:exonuclease SbcD